MTMVDFVLHAAHGAGEPPPRRESQTFVASPATGRHLFSGRSSLGAQKLPVSSSPLKQRRRFGGRRLCSRWNGSNSSWLNPVVREFVVGHTVRRSVSLNIGKMNGVIVCESVGVNLGRRDTVGEKRKFVTLRFPSAYFPAGELSFSRVLVKSYLELSIR